MINRFTKENVEKARARLSGSNVLIDPANITAETSPLHPDDRRSIWKRKRSVYGLKDYSPPETADHPGASDLIKETARDAFGLVFGLAAVVWFLLVLAASMGVI